MKATPPSRDDSTFTRRQALERVLQLGLLASIRGLLPSYAWAQSLARASRKDGSKDENALDLTIREIEFKVDERKSQAITINGTIPGPLIRLREGSTAVINVKNTLSETTSIHWHGILLPPDMDGVPGVSFAGIKPGETFTYRFPVKQSGTYWYHSHSGGQELMGMYGAIIIDPAQPDPFHYDREYVIVLSDWTSLHPMAILRKLKSDAGYFNFQKRALKDFASDISNKGVSATLSDRLEWSKMRMDPTDLSDVTGSTYSYLLNGLSASANWTGLFHQGEKLRLRFIGAASMTIFDVRIPGVKMTVIQADGQNIQPVTVDEFRIAPGETYDVIIELKDETAYTLFAETIDRSGYAMGTLAQKEGMRGPMPERRKRAVRTMADMGMSMSGMKMDGNDQGMREMSEMKQEASNKKKSAHESMPGMDMPSDSDMTENREAKSPIPGSIPIKHGPDHHGSGNSTVAEESRSRLHEPGIGLGQDNRRVLVYTDLKRLVINEDRRAPAREIELHLTGNMERYMWSINGKKYSEAPDPILFHNGERLRLTFVNDTMMEHPMHLHGMWMYLENGAGNYLPRKHTIIVKPAERLSVAITADAVGKWAFHCHMLLHMEMGMFRVVQVLNESPGAKS